MSGAQTDRPALTKLLDAVRAGDVLVIWKLDRLGRSLKNLIEIVNELLQRKVGLKSLNDPIDTTTPHGRFTFNIFASLAEFERDCIGSSSLLVQAMKLKSSYQEENKAVDRKAAKSNGS